MTYDRSSTPPSSSPPPAASHAIQAELVAVLTAVTDNQPRILTTQHGQSLPCGPFTMTHRSLQQGMRAWVESETHHPIGYVEQLYTFADPERLRVHGARNISISYLGLTREQRTSGNDLNAAAEHAAWRNWYDFFPWEDRRSDWARELTTATLLPALQQWATQAASDNLRQQRLLRISGHFGTDADAWNEDLVLQRYELLYEAGLVAEAKISHHTEASSRPIPGLAMLLDHRRILATGMARLRAKLKYRPVMYELMPENFTLLQLQQTAEAITGCWLHKQNFRRMVEQQALIEETGQIEQGVAGRPAKLFRFRSDITLERAIAGTKLPMATEPN